MGIVGVLDELVGEGVKGTSEVSEFGLIEGEGVINRFRVRGEFEVTTERMESRGLILHE
jgi:hypothetical protein